MVFAGNSRCSWIIINKPRIVWDSVMSKRVLNVIRLTSNRRNFLGVLKKPVTCTESRKTRNQIKQVLLYIYINCDRNYELFITL